jgi:hypothetical protein
LGEFGTFFSFKKYFENRLPRLRQLLTTELHKPAAAAFWPSRSKVCDPTAARNYMQVEQLCLRFLQNTISVGTVEDIMRYAICSSTGDT